MSTVKVTYIESLLIAPSQYYPKTDENRTKKLSNKQARSGFGADNLVIQNDAECKC